MSLGDQCEEYKWTYSLTLSGASANGKGARDGKQFIKVQVVQDVDNILQDVVNNIILNRISDGFVKFIRAFIVKVKRDHHGAYHIGSHKKKNIQFCAKAMIQSHVDGVMLYDVTFAPEHFLPLFNLFNVLKTVGQFGFVHNDAHSQNIMYDSVSKAFVLLDYGRVCFNQVFENVDNHFLLQKLEDLQANKNVSDLMKFDDPDLKIGLVQKYNSMLCNLYDDTNTYMYDISTICLNILFMTRSKPPIKTPPVWIRSTGTFNHLVHQCYCPFDYDSSSIFITRDTKTLAWDKIYFKYNGNDVYDDVSWKGLGLPKHLALLMQGFLFFKRYVTSYTTVIQNDGFIVNVIDFNSVTVSGLMFQSFQYFQNSRSCNHIQFDHDIDDLSPRPSSKRKTHPHANGVGVDPSFDLLTKLCLALNNALSHLPPDNDFTRKLPGQIAIYSKAVVETWSCLDKITLSAQQDFEQASQLIAQYVVINDKSGGSIMSRILVAKHNGAFTAAESNELRHRQLVEYIKSSLLSLSPLRLKPNSIII